MTIYVAGCSHVYGHGLADCLKGKSPSKFSWPELAREEGFAVFNASEPGNSPSAMQLDLMNYEDKENLEAIIALFPYSTRWWIKGRKGNEENFCPGKMNDYEKDRTFVRSLKGFYTHIKHERFEEQLLIGAVSYFHYIAKKFDCAFYCGFTDIEDMEITSDIFPANVVWEKYCEDNNCGKVADGHYNEAAHQLFYENEIRPFLDKNYVGFR